SRSRSTASGASASGTARGRVTRTISTSPPARTTRCTGCSARFRPATEHVGFEGVPTGALETTFPRAPESGWPGMRSKGDELNVKVRIASAGAVLGVLAVTATALASTPTVAQVKTRKVSTLGTILVDSKGKTLYLFMKDKSGKSACYGSCAANWPPYLTIK